MSPTCGQALSKEKSLPCLAEILQALEPHWSAQQRSAAAGVADRLIAEIPSQGLPVIGLAGAPGSGKSSLARLIERYAANCERQCVVLSLDDYYLGRAAREHLAARHPLFRQRGVPGTHNWDQLLHDLDRLRRGEIENLLLPKFNKLQDDTESPTRFRSVNRAPDLIILEGWMIGVEAQDEASLLRPLNQWEAKRDPDGSWRSLVNERLAGYSLDLKSRLDLRWFLAVPDWASVVEWRWQQELESARRSDASSYLDSCAAVAEFLAPFERIARHMLDSCTWWADRVIRLDHNHIMSMDPP